MVWIALISCAIWIYLLLGRGQFWRVEVPGPPSDPAAWPEVVAVVPARDEADVIGRVIGALLAQDYPGGFRVILIDDQSTDGTAPVARSVPDPDRRLDVVSGSPLPAGWRGKVWAMHQGAEQARRLAPSSRYVWFTDADIEHHPTNLRELVARAEAGGQVLASQMVMLHCARLWERLLIPAFVFFFRMLYPFAWVSDPRHRLGAAAGGCMLVRADALDAIGGVAAIRDALIDDCALGAALKRVGPIRLDLTTRAHSIRPYEGLGPIWRMIARSAFDQLDYSRLALIGTVLGMVVTYLVPPVAAGFAQGWARLFGLAAMAAMFAAYLPMLRFYRQSLLLAPALPIIAAIYCAATLDSARRHWIGRGGEWKGRVGAQTEAPAG